jgi:hypothetical protein
MAHALRLQLVRPANDHKCAAVFRLRESNAFRNYPALHREACNYLQRLHVQVIHRPSFLGLMSLHPVRTRDTPFASPFRYLLTMEMPIRVMLTNNGDAHSRHARRRDQG